MDEIKKGGQDSPEKQTSTATNESTPKTFTQAELDKALNDERADAGRKTAAKYQDKLNQLQTKVDELQDKVDQAEYANTPDALELRKRLRQQESDLKKAQQEFEVKKEQYDAEIERSKKAELKSRATRWASTVDGIEADDLIKHTDGTDAEMEAFVKKYGKPRKAEDNKEDINPDSGLATGSVLSFEEIRDRWLKNPNDPKIRQAYYEARRKKGL